MSGRDTVLTIGPVGKWLGGMLIAVTMGAGGYWVRENDKRADKLLGDVSSIAGSLARLTTDGATTRAALGALAEDVREIKGGLYTEADAARDRERQAEIDRAQTAMLERLRARVDRIEQRR